MPRPIYFLLLSLLGFTLPIATDSRDITKDSCDCQYCDEITSTTTDQSKLDTDTTEDSRSDTDTIDDSKLANNTTEDEDTLNAEDADGDGDQTICARDRDDEDRSFPSVCHMLCQNKCTQWRYVENTDEEVYIASAYRTNYYKLYDGPC